MNTKVEEALGARCEAAFVAIETAANSVQYDYRGGYGAELLLPLRDARSIIAELSERIAQQDATIARLTAALATIRDSTFRNAVTLRGMADYTLTQEQVK